MQFKEAGKRIQVLAYRGYDNEKKRAIIKMLGSLDKYSLSPSDGLTSDMTDDEKEELQSYIDKRRQSEKEEHLLLSARYINSQINAACTAINTHADAIDQAKADSIYLAIDELKKALRKAGFKRPEKTKEHAMQSDKNMSFWDMAEKKPD